jgi:primosomal protein N' (replication factor Y)
VNQTAQILFPVNVPTAFDYAVPEGLRIARGDFVYAPIGKQMKLGVVWSLHAAEAGRELKSIVDRKATRRLPPDMLDFVDWTARYNGASAGNVLRMAKAEQADPGPSCGSEARRAVASAGKRGRRQGRCLGRCR